MRALVCRNRQTNNKTHSGSSGLHTALPSSIVQSSLPGTLAPQDTGLSADSFPVAPPPSFPHASKAFLFLVYMVTSCSQFNLPHLLSALGRLPRLGTVPRNLPAPVQDNTCHAVYNLGLPIPGGTGVLKNRSVVYCCLMPNAPLYLILSSSVGMNVGLNLFEKRCNSKNKVQVC